MTKKVNKPEAQIDAKKSGAKKTAAKKAVVATKASEVAAKSLARDDLGPVSKEFINRIHSLRVTTHPYPDNPEKHMSRATASQRTFELAKTFPDRFVSISPGTYQKLEDGYIKNVSIDYAVTLCAVFGNNIGVLINGAGMPNVQEIQDQAFELLNTAFKYSEASDIAQRIANLEDHQIKGIKSIIRAFEVGNAD